MHGMQSRSISTDGNAHWEVQLALRDGTRVRVRPIRPDDTERLRAFHASLSADTIMMRFFHLMPELPRSLAEHFTHVDYQNRMALVALQGDSPGERFLGVVRYDRIGPAQAEVAFVVEDHWQGHGIATALLLLLARYARERGFSSLVAITMGSNLKMLDVLKHCGYPCTLRYADGEIEGTLDISALSPLEAQYLAPPVTQS
jgi:RimJ/RimL family protein N-acetyltransferase